MATTLITVPIMGSCFLKIDRSGSKMDCFRKISHDFHNGKIVFVLLCILFPVEKPNLFLVPLQVFMTNESSNLVFLNLGIFFYFFIFYFIWN